MRLVRIFGGVSAKELVTVLMVGGLPGPRFVEPDRVGGGAVALNVEETLWR